MQQRVPEVMFDRKKKKGIKEYSVIHSEVFIDWPISHSPVCSHFLLSNAHPKCLVEPYPQGSHHCAMSMVLVEPIEETRIVNAPLIYPLDFCRTEVGIASILCVAKTKSKTAKALSSRFFSCQGTTTYSSIPLVVGLFSKHS